MFIPNAKSSAARGRTGIRPIGMQLTGIELTKTKEAIQKAIGKKDSRYGVLDRPYIIAVNVLSPFVDQEDILDAHFGSEQVTFPLDMPDDQSLFFSQARDGMWFRPSGPKNTHVSDVLIVKNLTAWTIGHSDVTLYHNSCAQYRNAGAMTTLSQALPENGKIIFKNGVHLRDLLGLEMNWPEI